MGDKAAGQVTGRVDTTVGSATVKLQGKQVARRAATSAGDAMVKLQDGWVAGIIVVTASRTTMKCYDRRLGKSLPLPPGPPQIPALLPLNQGTAKQWWKDREPGQWGDSCPPKSLWASLPQYFHWISCSPLSLSQCPGAVPFPPEVATHPPPWNCRAPYQHSVSHRPLAL